MDIREARTYLQQAYRTDRIRFYDLPDDENGNSVRKIVDPDDDGVYGVGAHSDRQIAGGMAAKAYFEALEP
jgi:hypothetical protein